MDPPSSRAGSVDLTQVPPSQYCRTSCWNGYNSYWAFCCQGKHIFRWICINTHFLGGWNVSRCLLCWGVSFPSPAFMVKSGSTDAVSSCQVVSVLWNLFKIKPVVSYLLSWNRSALLFLIVTVFKGRKILLPLQKERETPPGFQGALWFFCPFFPCAYVFDL